MDQFIKAVFLPILFCFLFAGTTHSKNAPGKDEKAAWESYTPSQKYKTINEWIEKASDRIRYSHQARSQFATSAYEYSILTGDENMKMKAMLCLAELYLNEARFDESLQYLDSLKVYANATKNIALSVKTDNYIATIYRYKGKTLEALGMVNEAYLLAKKHSLKGLVSQSANNLGIMYRILGENKIGLEFNNEAMQRAIMEADTHQVIVSLSGIGNHYRSEKNYEQAHASYLEAMKLAQQSKDIQHTASLHNHLGTIARERQQYDQALEHYNAAFQLLDQVSVTGLKPLIIRNTGLVQQAKGNYQPALELIQQSLAISKEIGAEFFIKENYQTLSQLYHTIGNTEEAYKNLLLFTDINQEINSRQLINRISYYNDKIFNALRTQELYKFRLQNNLYILAIVIIVLASLGIVSYLLFRRSSERKKQYERLKNTLQDKIIIEKALRQSEENYQTLIKTLNEGLIVLDKDNKIEFLNLKASNILGSNDRNDLLGHDFEDFLLTPDDEKLFQEKVELQKMGISDHYEIKMKNLIGDVLWAHLSSAPILDENLRTKGNVTLISDITEKKKSEQSYSELTVHLNQKIKQLNCLYDITDISGVPGITFEEIMEKSLEIIPVGLRYSHDIGVQIVFDNTVYASKNYIDTPWSYSVPIKVQKKKLGFIKVAYVEEKPNINKDPFHFNEKILLKNISEKFGKIIESKNLERVLRENQQKLQDVQRIAKIGNWEKEFSSDNCTFSETFFDIAGVGYEKRKFFDHSKLVELIHPDDKDIFLDFESKLTQSVKDGHDITANYRIITSEGSIRHIFSSGKINFDEMHNKTGCVFTVQDITEQKNNQQLQHHAELALKTSEAKQQVVANISYEMRTPITGIMGMVDFLLESGLTPDQLELAKTIKDSSIGLLNSINNILDLQRIEAGKFKLNNNILSISNLLNKITSLFTALTRNKEIRLELDIDPQMPESIISDQDRLYQVITSLISIITENASGKGIITIHLRKEKVSGVGLMIIVEIADNFSTIDIDEVNEILYPSKESAEVSVLNRKDNLSVGLAISRKLIDLLDGKIGVERNKDNGTTFYFTFLTTLAPQTTELVEKKQTGTKAIQKIKGVKILCVEDQKINQKVISLMLSHAQCKVTLANNGKEAIDILDKETFDIVLLDMVMPVMDGMETLEVIAKRFSTPPPVIALSANVLDEDKDRYYFAGVQDFISKPIDADELYTKIEKWSKRKKKTSKLKKV